MNSHADTPVLVSAEHSATNRKLLARQAAARTDRIESASRKVSVTLSSPEGKRLYLRCFEITQINFHYITVFARMKVADAEVERIEQELRTMLDTRLTRLNQALVEAEAKCTAHGISALATYDVEPLLFEAKVFSMLDRRLLELIEKVDQLMPMLETLCIDEAITPSQLIVEKSKVKKTVRGTTKAVRIIRASLERKANTVSGGQGDGNDIDTQFVKNGLQPGLMRRSASATTGKLAGQLGEEPIPLQLFSNYRNED